MILDFYIHHEVFPRQEYGHLISIIPITVSPSESKTTPSGEDARKPTLTMNIPHNYYGVMLTDKIFMPCPHALCPYCLIGHYL